jgi:hypothetical protein
MSTYSEFLRLKVKICEMYCQHSPPIDFIANKLRPKVSMARMYGLAAAMTGSSKKTAVLIENKF